MRLKAALQQSKDYDRNLSSRKAVLAAIGFIHRNPIRRGLVEDVTHWKWSSTRGYASVKLVVDLDLPTIRGLPPFARVEVLEPAGLELDGAVDEFILFLAGVVPEGVGVPEGGGVGAWKAPRQSVLGTSRWG